MDVGEVRYTGRFEKSPEGMACAWSASTVAFRFYGTGVTASIRASGRNYLLVLVDSKISLSALPVMEDGLYALADGLPLGEHDIRIVKKTEYYLGILTYKDFHIEDGHLLPLTKPSGRRIEFYGDSITCGFGVEADNGHVPYDPVYDNAWLSYAQVACRELEAEGTLISWSGFGLIRDYTGNERDILPDHYHRITQESLAPWDFSAWVPQMVVINLGTNDFSIGIPDRRAFTQAYIRFVKEIRGRYPEARILCTLGPVIGGKELEYSREFIRSGVVEQMRGEGMDWVYFQEFDPQRDEDGYGVSMHPSAITHEKTGKRLAEAIRSLMEWE